MRTIFILLFTAGVFTGGVLLYWVSTLQIPDFSAFNERKIIQSTKIYDRTGETLLWNIHENIKRTVVPFENISRHIKNATVAIEDSNFYNHKGIDVMGIIRAFWVNFTTGEIRQGASTISQQLIKNAFLTTERSYTRKIKEVILTFKLEQALSKEEILDFYLNEIPYGGSKYGIEAASQDFFGKPAEELTLAESAYLAALPQAPTYYSPYGNNRDKLENRKSLVLKRMKNLDFITEEDEKQANEEQIIFLGKGDQSIKAPHFSIFIRSYLEEKYGKDAVEQNGLKIITTLDYELQQKAEELVKKHVEENTEKFTAYNAGLVGIDPKTGQLLVMVGSKDWHTDPLPEGCLPGIDCKFEPKPNVTAYGKGRQPGSSIKPFIYATAFKKGYTPDTVVFDLKTEFNASCNTDFKPKPNTNTKEDECYHPKNYDNIFRGPTTLKEALAQSINLPSVKTLYLTGLNDSLKTIKDMGITTLDDPGRYGLTLVLGGGEVTLLELTGAYSIFANNGIKNKITGILKIEDSEGNILEEFKPSQKQVIDKNIALIISNILSDNDARAPAFGRESWLHFPERDVAVKTGTTNDYRDAWVVGYTPNFSLGVWFGNNDNSSMEKKVAGFIAAPLWNAFFNEVFLKIPSEEFEDPKPQYANQTIKPFLRGEWRGGETYKVDKISQKLATEHTPEELIEEKLFIQIHTILNWLDKNNPTGPKPENPENDSQFELWENPVRKWAEAQHIKEITIKDIPQEFDDIHKPEYAPKITIESPTADATYNAKNIMNIRFSYESKYELDQADFFFGSIYLGSSKKDPFAFSFIPSGIIPETESNNSIDLKIIVYDKVRNKTEFSIPIRLQF